jgi:hypothetical protein
LSIFGRFLRSYAIKASMGLKSPFNPFAKICARYLESLDNNESAYLELSPKCLIKASKNNSSSESEFETYFLGSISLIFISASLAYSYFIWSFFDEFL